MKKYLFILLSLALTSCFQKPEGIGFLSDEIYLKGYDTLFVSIGGKAQTDYAWTDNSSQPYQFSIENIKDKSGNRSEQFFKNYTYRTWIKPYDYLKDKTEEAVMAKLMDIEMPCFFINEVNGQLQYVETTSNLSADGDVYHVDVRVTNSKTSKVYPDYAILKLTSSTRAYVLQEVINGISVVKGGTNYFVLYDQINSSQPDFTQRRDNIYADNGIEFARIHKVSNEPAIGVKIIFKLLDSKGNVFEASKYDSYIVNGSYIDVSINRQNTPEGMILEFPTTPWPVDPNFMSYLKSPTFNNFNYFDIAKLYTDFQEGKVPSLIAKPDWPDNNWADAEAWFVRIRSKITFYESGTWEIACKVPYTFLDGNFQY